MGFKLIVVAFLYFKPCTYFKKILVNLYIYLKSINLESCILTTSGSSRVGRTRRSGNTCISYAQNAEFYTSFMQTFYDFLTQIAAQYLKMLFSARFAFQFVNYIVKITGNYDHETHINQNTDACLSGMCILATFDRYKATHNVEME